MWSSLVSLSIDHAFQIDLADTTVHSFDVAKQLHVVKHELHVNSISLLFGIRFCCYRKNRYLADTIASLSLMPNLVYCREIKAPKGLLELKESPDVT